MKRILITAGGTGIAWHICKVAKEHFLTEFEIHICDINDPELVPASIYADYVHIVPLSNQKEYIEEIQRIVSQYKIDIIIPLLPEEGEKFAKDSDFVISNSLWTSAPSLNVYKKLTDKKKLYLTLKELGINTPTVFFEKSEINPLGKYIIKPRIGFGSLGVKTIDGQTLLDYNSSLFSDSGIIIQECCSDEDPVEVTVECFNSNGFLKIFARQRISVKSGVCVKTRYVDSEIFMDDIKKLVTTFEMPTAFNAQYMLFKDGWKMFDLNLRLGAGTPLATACGFQLTRAFLSSLLEKNIKEEYFNVDHDIKTVLRVYQEIVIK